MTGTVLRDLIRRQGREVRQRMQARQRRMTTMTTNDDHAKKLREMIGALWATDTPPDARVMMMDCLADLVAERDAAEAERDHLRVVLATEQGIVDRLRDAYLDVEDDFADIALERTGMTRDEFKAECRRYLHDGDLPDPDAEGDAS